VAALVQHFNNLSCQDTHSFQNIPKLSSCPACGIKADTSYGQLFFF